MSIPQANQAEAVSKVFFLRILAFLIWVNRELTNHFLLYNHLVLSVLNSLSDKHIFTDAQGSGMIYDIDLNNISQIRNPTQI